MSRLTDFIKSLFIEGGPQSSATFENADFSPHRGSVPGAAPRDAKLDFTPTVRRELSKRTRYASLNSGLMREMVGNISIYSTGDGIRPQAKSPDKEWNSKAQAYFKQWGERCDITNRFSFAECQVLVCRGIDTDGEYFVHKTRRNGEPAIQLLESHRIGDPQGNSDDGIISNPFGEPIAYKVIGANGLAVPISADKMLHIFEPERVSLVRNFPTVQHSINHMLDEMEMLAIEKRAVKDNSDVTRVLKRDEPDLGDGSDFNFEDTQAVDEGTTNPGSLQEITGGKVVALKPNESLESFVSNRPSPTFTGFLEHIRRDMALGVIPYEFVADSSKIGGAGVRLVVGKADRRFSWRQTVLISRLIQPIWFYVIGDAINRGRLDAVPNWWQISCVTPRRATVDAGREAQQNREDVSAGLKNLSDHYEELGADFEEEVTRRAMDIAFIFDTAAQFKVPPEMLWTILKSQAPAIDTPPQE